MWIQVPSLYEMRGNVQTLTNEHLDHIQCDNSDNEDAFPIEDDSSSDEADREHQVANRESESKLLLLLWTGYYTARPVNIRL